MNTSDLLLRWSTMSLDDIETQLREGADSDAVERLLGAEELAEIRELIEEPQTRGLREAVVLLPGIMGSHLTSIRGVTTLLWINPALFLKGQTSYLKLNQEGTQDAHPEVETVPAGNVRLVYLKISQAMRRKVDLYEFPYDWRRPIEYNGDQLHECIERWAHGDPNRQFTLIGHSMGGLVSRAYMAGHPEAADRRVKRLIMHGTPHYGAAGAVENLILGNDMTAIASKLNSANDLVDLVRNLPSIYQLVPAPPSLFPPTRPYPVNWDVYDAKAWRVDGIRQDYLDAARRFYEMLDEADPQVEVIEIAGCNEDTLVEVERSFGPDERPEYKHIRLHEGPDAGDGTVPLWSALLPKAAIYYIQEVHRNLPKNKAMIEATLELIHGGTPNLPTELPPPSGVFRREVPMSADMQARQLTDRLEQGTVTAEDLAVFYSGL